MAWTSPRTWTTGELVTASIMNTHVRDNFLATAVATVTTAGDMAYATAANTLARLAIGAANRVLTSTGSAPQWVESLSLGGSVGIGTAASGTSGSLRLFNSGTDFSAIQLRGSDATNSLARISFNSDNWESYAAIVGCVDDGVSPTGGSLRVYTSNNAGSPSHRWTFAKDGHFLTATDNAYDIGASGATRPRILYLSAGLGINAAPVEGRNPFRNSAALTSGSGLDIVGLRNDPSMTTAHTDTVAYAYYSNASVTVNSAVTCVRAAQIAVEAVIATVNGTLTNHNALYLGTPGGGSTVRVIDTASGAYLTTGGTWTNNPSWDRYKTEKKPLGERTPDGRMARPQVRSWLDWLADNHIPAFYRHDGRPLDEGVEDTPRPRHQDYEHDTLFFSLDHWPEDMRQAITVDAQGGIGTKDTDGLLLALVAEQRSIVRDLEGEIAQLRAELHARRN